MTEVVFQPGLRRLRVSGECTAADAEAVCAEIARRGPLGGRLTVDLTGVTALSPDAATSLARTVATIEADGCRVTILRKADGEVDVLLRGLSR